MVRKKKIKLTTSNFFKRKRKLNRSRRKLSIKLKFYIFKKRKPLNKIVKTKTAVKKNNKRPYSNISKNPTSNRYLPDIIEKRYIFIVIIILLVFSVIGISLIE